MASTATQNNELLTATLARWVEKNWWDNISEEYPLMWYFRGKQAQKPNLPRHRRGSVMLQGGESIRGNAMLSLNNTAKRIANYTPINLTPQENASIAQIEWRSIAASITIADEELLKNQASDTQITNLLTEKTKSAMTAVEDKLSSDMFSDGTETNQVTGLEAAVLNSGTYAQINSTTNPQWKADVTTSVGAFATNGKTNMYEMINTISFGIKKPDLLVTTQSIFESYHNTLDDQIRYTSTRVLDGAGVLLDFSGVPVIFDRDCPSGTMYALNSDNIYWVGMRGADATVKPFVDATPNGQLAKVALIHLMGNLFVNERRKLGKLTGIT